MIHSTDSGRTAGTSRGQRWRRILVRTLTVAAVAGVVIVAVGIWAAQTLPGRAAARMGRLTNTRVRMGAFDFHLDGSVSIDGLAVWPVQEELRDDNAILRAKNVYVRFSRRSLVRLSPRITEIRLRDFLLDARLNLDTGRWNLSDLQLHLRGGAGDAIPTVSLERGKLRYAKVSGSSAEVVTSVPVEARFGLDEEPYQGYRFELKTSKLSGGHGESHLTGSWRPGELTLAGGLSSTDIPSLARVWAVDVLAASLQYDQNGDYTLDLRLKDVHGKQAPEVDALRLIMPSAAGGSTPLVTLQKFFSQYQPTGMVRAINIKASGNFDKPYESEIAGKLVCTDVSVCDRNFPYAIDHLSGELDFTQSTMLVNRLSGKHGEVDVHIEGWTKGFGSDRQYQYRMVSENMILDQALYAALRPEQQRLWDAFQPSGVVAADYRQVRTSPTDKRLYLSVQLNGVAATYRKFPYPLTELTGGLYFDRDSISILDVVSHAGGRQIRMNGKVTDRGTGKPVYYISIDANDIPLDAALGEALPPGHREMYKRFEANGTVDMRAKVFNLGDANNVGPVSFLADVSCHMASLKLSQLPFVLSDVTAAAAITPDSLSVKRLSGHYGASPVALAGGTHFAKDDKPTQYHLSMTADRVPLNSETIALLPGPLARQVAAFRPEGNVNLTAELKKADSNEPPGYRVAVECLGDKVNHERLACPLQEIRGTITATNERVVFRNVTAKPAWKPEGGGQKAQEGATSIASNPPSEELPAAAEVQIDGSITLAGGGFEGAAFAVKARDVAFTRELGDALPKGLRPLYQDLSLEGPFDLDLTALHITKAGAAEAQNKNLAPLQVEFDGKASLKTCRLKLAGAGAELCGTLQAAGSYQTGHGFTDGRMRLDAERLVIRGKPVTSLAIDARYDPGRQKWSAGNFTGACCGGKVLGGLEVANADKGGLQYLLWVALNRVDLEQFLLAGGPANGGRRAEDADQRVDDDSANPPSPSSGVMNAALSLGARLGDGSSRRGACQIEVADMRVGKVSPLAKLLAVLRLNEPADYTFERMVIESFVKQDKLLIRTFDLSGKNVAFAGSGKMDLPSEEVDLQLTARGRRLGTAEPSVLQSLTEGLGGAVVRVEVTGQAENPHIETKALPVIGDSLKILGTPK